MNTDKAEHMSAAAIRSMGRNILSDGKVPAEPEDIEGGTDIEHMHIEPIANGHMVTTHMKAAKDGKMGEVHKNFFKTHDEVSAHVAHTLGGKKKY